MKIAFRVDASIDIGTGHVMRCLALAEYLREQETVTRFLCRRLPGNLGERILAQGHALAWVEGETWEEDAKASHTALQDAAPWDWLVVDHYGLDARWERAMRTAARKILAIDDLANRPHDCDLLLDQNYYPDAEGRYEGLVPAYCLKLLGPRYALLRPQFARARETLRERSGEVKRILVCFGGTDPHGATLKALEAIRLLDRPDIAVDVVIGGSNPHREEIEAACRALPQSKLHQDVEDMASLMAAADLFVGAGGSITWERCCLGLPAVVMTSADNQRQAALVLAEAGVHLLLGRVEEVDADRLCCILKELAQQPALVRFLAHRTTEWADGHGCTRVIQYFREKQLELRLATMQDRERLYAWRNHPVVREGTRRTDEIPYTEHVRWFKRVLSDPKRILLIGEDGGIPVGCVRFDIHDRQAEISIYLDPELIGQGWGGRLLRAAEKWLIYNRQEVEKVLAEVKMVNIPSKEMFLNQGYRVDRLVLAKTLGSSRH